ncbi:DUF262 domain-containing protein [Bacteroides sp. 214]|uniref:DUF262 domain-containing protein n=1 Tax=Bacteroides sp. 214 TaxID=2302935 RepID=UPI0013D6A8BB|nr:DUF262 domain-containing protein [Bacteroides sp. 214]NDW12479.1 DUF262 domain-containing protein [Bacteroides sp. 214]
MATKNLLGTRTVSLNDIFNSSNIYRVPQFQRDYSWTQDNWEDLWNDIEIAVESKQMHYMGSIVLQSNDSKDFLIIDGQQRFTTLSILVLAIISEIELLVENKIEENENKERVNLLMTQYIGQKDPSSLSYSSKLFLNENNDSFYQSRLLKFKKPLNISKLSDSEKLMWNAFVFFKDRVSKHFKDISGAKLASFLNNDIGELMMFIQITVEDELNAYTVFETLNSRGVELTSTDLLKNYLFSLVAKSDIDLQQVKNQWKRIIDVVGLKDFPAFLRYYLVATRKQISKEYLFKEIKNYVKLDKAVFELLDRLEFYAYNYMALAAPGDELWNTDKDNHTAIIILKTFRVTQWKPLLMVACEKFEVGSNDFKRLLQAIVVISYRYNVIAKLQTNEMEKVYSRAAINLYRNPKPTIQGVLNDLKSIYVDDEKFKHYFSLKQFNTNNSTDKKSLRYTLYNLESQENGGCLYDFDTDKGTIEHILPESYPAIWQTKFTEDEFSKNVYKLGNLTILESSKNNKEAADKDFETKKIIYKTSKYAITKVIDDTEWKLQNINIRQNKFSKLACGIWKIQF